MTSPRDDEPSHPRASKVGVRSKVAPVKRLAAVLASLALVAGCRDHAHHEPPPPTASSANPVQEEMSLLTSALESAVRGIGQGDVRGVEHQLHRVHAAKAATEAAIRDGRYKPPRNADNLPRFRELDEAFHGELERLVDASRKNDVPATAAALGSVMQRCQGCHTEFRR